MKTDGKAVYLILHVREGAKELALGFNAYNSWWKTIEHLAGAVTIVLGKSGNGNLQV